MSSSKRKNEGSSQERKNNKKQAKNHGFSPSKPSTSTTEYMDVDEDSFFEDSNPSAVFKSITVSDSNIDKRTPGRKRSFKRISVNNQSPQLPMNDDGTELIEGEDFEGAEKESDKDAITKDDPDQGMSIVHSMTMDQMKEHVSRCLELNTENKINAKNAFALRLIDCMTVLSKSEDDSNFAAMACQLDAGAKIYSLRVDAVHQQVVKLVDSCIYAEKKANTETGEGGADSDDENQPGTSDGKTKEKKKRRKKVLASHDQITRALKENDPKDKYFSCEALPGGIFGQVRIDPQDLSLTLAKNTPFWVNWTDYKPSKAEETTCEVEKIAIEDKAIGPNLEGTIDPSSFSVLEHSYIEQPKEEPTEPVDLERPIRDSDDDDDDDFFKESDAESKPEANTDAESEPTLTEVQLISRAMSRMSKAGNKEVSRLDALNAVFHRSGESEYHYLKKCNSKYWAGPKRGIKKVANKKKPRKKKEPKAIMYTDDGMKKPLNPVSKTTGLPTKRRTTLSAKMCTKWKMPAVTFPQDIHFNQNILVMLFHIELENVSVFHENQNDPPPEEDDSLNVEDIPDHPVEEELAPAGFDLEENLLDGEVVLLEAEVEFMDILQESTDSEDFPGFEAEGEDGSSANEPMVQAEPMAEATDEEKAELEGVEDSDPNAKAEESCEAYEGDNLVPMVKIVNVEPIKYSVKPHRIDMGHLKQVMFSIIVRMLEDRENEMRSGGQNQGQAYVQFRDVLTELMNSDDLDPRTREDLSTAMVFLTLLFLANENNLRLEPPDANADSDPRISYMSGEIARTLNSMRGFYCADVGEVMKEERSSLTPYEPDDTDTE